MSRIDDLIAEHCPKGVEMKTLGEVGVFIRSNGLQESDLTDVGAPAVHYGQVHTHYGVWADSAKSYTDSKLAARLRRAKPGEDEKAVGEAATVRRGAVGDSGMAAARRSRSEGAPSVRA